MLVNFARLYCIALNQQNEEAANMIRETLMWLLRSGQCRGFYYNSQGESDE